MGLTDTQTIGRIIVHPTNPDIVYVAASGHEWTDNEKRGVFKTTDGGKTWNKVFYKSPRTGAWDLVMDPANPDIALRLDVAAHPAQVERSARRARLQRRRHLEDDRRRQDAGPRRTPASRRREHRGRIGIDIARSNPKVLYAFVDNYEPGGRRRKASATPTAGRSTRRASRRPRSTAPTTRARRGAR